MMIENAMYTHWHQPEARASVQGEPSDLTAARAELAETARAIARLLTRDRYDEAELAELDVRARELRARISASRPPVWDDEDVWERRHADSRSDPLPHLRPLGR